MRRFGAGARRFLLDAFTPKLWAKITVVTILSVNAMFVASVAIPILNGHAGKRISALPRTARRALFAVAGVSAASWLMAMVMGSSVLLKTAPAWLFQSALPLSYVLGIVIATLVGERLYARPMAARSQSAPFAQSARKPAPTPDVHAPAAKARRPAPPRAAVTVLSPGAPPPDRSGVARHMPGEALRTPPATSPAKQPSQHADPAPVAAQARKRPPAAKIKPPKVELRASDLAIAFPQKLKRGPRLKADPDGATGQRSAQAVTRARLLDVAAELQRTSS
ncbi:MAG: hypothetical protein AAFW64_10105 [Pseudomonadota bacterium]